MGQQNRSDSYLGAVLKLNTLGVLIFQIHIITDENSPRNVYSAQLVQKRTQG
jgi:hypothetical protein